MRSSDFTLAIFGRTNVGKSTLFNRIVGKRSALVFDRNGVTRDSKEMPAEIFGKKISLIDTPGMFDYDKRDQDPELSAAISKKLAETIELSTVILFVIDGLIGITEYDREIAKILRKSGKKIIVVVNKCENKNAKMSYSEATEFGFEDIVQISAEHGMGVPELLELVFPLINDNITEEQEDNSDIIKLAFIGRPNVGKSTIVNKILGEEKQLAANFSGLTRESAAHDFEFAQQKIRIIDTPGIRRKAKIDDVLERISVSNSVNSYRNADIVILVIDALSLENEQVEKQDLTLASNILKTGKTLIIASNKCDKTNYKKNEMPTFLKDHFSRSLAQLKSVPFLFISALRNENIDKMLRLAIETFCKQKVKIKTPMLNDWLAEMRKTDTILRSNVKLKYITQIKTLPPTFILFVSNKEGIRTDKKRFIINSLKQSFDLENIVVNLFFRDQKNALADRRREKSF
ncbi:GTPase Der [Alphaproteobacteria bacterium]|nr:GTPase Der [Alphaproteobacteria bacterium]